jgi:hypothetical protein
MRAQHCQTRILTWYIGTHWDDMRSISLTGSVHLIAVALTVLVLAGCAHLPAMDEAAKGPQIDDLVRRIKCDLYGGFAGPLSAPQGYEWLRTWTAQANLNLIVSDQSQLTPGAVLTTPLRATTVPFVVTNFAQSFNMGLGAQLSNTATRNEGIIFTVSMDELIQEFGNGHEDCRFPDNIDLQSELGIKEWITHSLSPADHRYLDIGYHKPPKAGTGAAAATASKTIQGVGKATSDPKFIAALATLKNTNVPGPKRPECLRPPGGNPESPDRADIQLDLEVVACDLFTFQPVPPSPPVHDLKNLDGKTVMFVAKTIRDIQRTIMDLMILGEAGQKVRTALENTATALAVFVDPPFDTISHQAQFIIALNASASPSWTLLRFKGPSPAGGSLASVTKTKTHTLNVVIGPPGSSDAQGALAALQTGTALTNALNSGAISIVTH